MERRVLCCIFILYTKHAAKPRTGQTDFRDLIKISLFLYSSGNFTSPVRLRHEWFEYIDRFRAISRQKSEQKLNLDAHFLIETGFVTLVTISILCWLFKSSCWREHNIEYPRQIPEFTYIEVWTSMLFARIEEKI